MEIKMRIVVPDDYTGNGIKLTAGTQIEIIRQSELVRENNSITGEEFTKRMNEVIRKHFGYFGSKVDKACDEIIRTAWEYNIASKSHKCRDCPKILNEDDGDIIAIGVCSTCNTTSA